MTNCFPKVCPRNLSLLKRRGFKASSINYVEGHYAENVFIKNENFSNLDFKDKNARVLALFTYWNIIEYFFPYKYQMDKDWDLIENTHYSEEHVLKQRPVECGVGPVSQIHPSCHVHLLLMEDLREAWLQQSCSSACGEHAGHHVSVHFAFVCAGETGVVAE